MLEMTVAPGGGTGAFPLTPGAEVGVEGVVLPELDDPEVPEPISWLVVVPVDDESLPFETAQPVNENIPIDNVPMA